MEVRIIQHNSSEYEQMAALRITELLNPIGVPASYIDRKKEQYDILIGAFENDQMIGCCILSPKNDDTIQLRQMAVKTNYRGRGIGKEIIEFAEQVAKENNYSILMMHARNPVIAFYKRNGYQISGDEFFEVGIPHHKMQKQLR
jgi:predicted GNAT family N-acyltransferase